MNLRTMERTAALFLGISVFAVTAGITSSYLTSYPEQLENIVSTGFLGIVLKEPGWNEQEAENLLPRSTVTKNPTSENTGNTSAWMFARVTVPLRTIALVDEKTRRKTEEKETELFSFQVLPEWEQISRRQQPDSVEYVFGYQQIVEPGKKTAPLFEQVMVVNYLEGELSGEEVLEIPVEVMAIQSSACASGTSLAEIYQIYLQQETNYAKKGAGV